MAHAGDVGHVRGMRGGLVVVAAAWMGCSSGSPSLEGSATAATSSNAAPAPSSSAQKTAMPAADEWRNAPMVEVGEAAAMGCNGRKLREWLRVACSGRSDSGGKPTTVQVTGGERAFALALDGSTSVVVPVYEGTRADVDFAWTDGTRTLVVEWKKGEPKPSMLAKFVGTAPRLEATSGQGEHRACACFREVTGKATCDDMVIVNPSLDECAATYQDCLEVLECAAGKSKKWPKCPANKRNLPPFGTCTHMCGPSLPACPAGTTCNEGIGGLCQ